MDAREMHQMIREIRADLYSAADVFNMLSLDGFDIESSGFGQSTIKTNTRFSAMAGLARTLLRDLAKVRKEFNNASLAMVREGIEQRRKERIQRQGGKLTTDN